MKYYGYTRVSTETQVESGFGLDTQRNGIEDYAEKNGIEISEWFTDEGISGTDVSRAGLTDLLATMENDDKVIVLNTSRLWRDETVKVLVHFNLKKIHGDVISVEQSNYSIYSKDATSFLINGMLELLDQYSRLEINMKLAKGRKTKAATKGQKACGTAPIGYTWNKDATLSPDPATAPIVKEIYQNYSEYKSLAKVAEICREKGYKTSRGKDFSRTSLHEILNNNFYIGITTHAGIEYKGAHEPIISRDLFTHVQSILHRRSVA